MRVNTEEEEKRKKLYVCLKKKFVYEILEVLVINVLRIVLLVVIK